MFEEHKNATKKPLDNLWIAYSFEELKSSRPTFFTTVSLKLSIFSCLRHKDSFEEAVVCAVNHDGDSDSTGSIAGNIMGAYLGEEAIPNYYLDNLELRNVIEEIANDLATPIPVSEYSANNDEYWLSKYLDCSKK